MGRRIRIRDKNRIPEVVERMEELNGSKVRIGVFGSNADSQHEGSSITIGHIAAIHEFGTKIAVTDKMRKYLASQGLFLKQSTNYITIPERSFIRAGWDENEKEILDKTERLIRDAVALEVSIDDVLDGCGMETRGRIQRYARDLRDPANHPFTVEQKNSSNPLVDGGQLIASIDYEVMK